MEEMLIEGGSKLVEKGSIFDGNFHHKPTETEIISYCDTEIITIAGCK